MQAGGAPFVAALYRQVLHREPNPAELQRGAGQLAAGVPKVRVAAELMASPAAEQMYRDLPTRPMDRLSRTIANVMQQILPSPELAYIYAMYAELLNRNPSAPEIDARMASLRQGHPRLKMLEEMLLSPEAQAMLKAAAPPVDSFARPSVYRGDLRSGREPRRIGIFLIYTEAVRLDGEGISRFTVSLVEGLLTLNPGSVIQVATNVDNAESVRGLFASANERFGGRVAIHVTNSVEQINRDVRVDAWIVPYVGLMPALGLEQPFVLCLHDLVHWHYPDVYYKEDPARCHILDRFAYDLAHRADAVTFLSDHIRQHEGLRFLGLEAPRTHVVRHAAPDAHMGIVPEHDFRHKYGLHGEYVTFPTVLRLHKNGERLIEGFALYKSTEDGQASGLQLVLTDTPDRMLQNAPIRGLIESCPDIRFIGRIPGQDLPSLYRYASGTIVPTLFEGGFPLPILESLTVGTPAAAARIGVVREVVPHADILFGFDPHDANDIARAIVQLRQLGRHRISWQRDAARGVLARTWIDVAQDFDNIIRQL